MTGLPMPNCPACNRHDKVAYHDSPGLNNSGVVVAVAECERCGTEFDARWHVENEPSVTELVTIGKDI